MRELVLAAVALIALGSAAPSYADSLLFDRGLPSANLNNGAGASRSNVTWASELPTGFTGDDFRIGSAGEKYVIDSLTVWGAQYDPLSLDIDNIWLYLGKSGDPLALVSTGAVSGNSNSNPGITHTYVTYPGTEVALYQGNESSFYPIAQTTFGGLNYVVEGGVTYNFGVKGDGALWWNHASNAPLSGVRQDGADGRYLEFNTENLALVAVWDSAPCAGDAAEHCGGWDKSSDINVAIEGHAVPEPATLTLLGLGLAGVVRAARRRK